jgi:hypothetical protein
MVQPCPSPHLQPDIRKHAYKGTHLNTQLTMHSITNPTKYSHLAVLNFTSTKQRQVRMALALLLLGGDAASVTGPDSVPVGSFESGSD